ncbi:MAG: helix-turn-helix transcriptional regulator [Acidimicrobiales bacterium]|nr:helix-turn-helix transcriptional regulator [Acidimicrobiales bacterium]
MPNSPHQPDPHDPDARERLGRRIAAHRAKLGWTQQELAERLAVSRVAVSHLESSLSAPGERTVALLAGVFGLEPHELVAGTDYPVAKADRLPLVVARHTELDLQLALLDQDLGWIEHTPDAHALALLESWQVRIGALAAELHDPREQVAAAEALERLRRLRDERLTP